MSNVALLLAFLLGTSATAAPGVSAGSSGPETPGTPDTPGAQCDVATESGMPPAEGDETRARSACQIARARFAELFGDPVPGVRVILWEEAHYRMGLLRGEAAIFWPSSQALAPRTDDRTAAEEHVASQWREVLPHEISHLLLAVRFFRDAPASRVGEYGTPLPDWLDEAVAIWAEPTESRQRRIEQARELPPEYLDLRAILVTPHPATGQSAAYIARDGTARPADFTLWAFYPQAIAVLAFIYEHGGTAATTELVRRLTSDPAEPAGPRVLAELPGLPVDVAGIETAWSEWLENRK
jgi:hypothetical protein